MTKRDVIRMVMEGEKPPYVPWSCSFTIPARAKLVEHFGTEDLEDVFDNHFLGLGGTVDCFTEIGNDCVRDVFGVTWDRSVDKDIGTVIGCVLPEPTLAGYEFPDPVDSRYFDPIPERIERYGDLFRVFRVDFSLFERAWTLRGMESLMMDFIEHPDFAHKLLNTIADFNIAQIREALKYEIDAVYFGDDWGQQRGLLMGPVFWRKFILPVLKRMYSVVREADRIVMIHSCGDVDELFDDLIDIGLGCFNPFQPEVMDVAALVKQYRGRLAFHGGLSIQRVLPYGSPSDVAAATRRLMDIGREGSYIFSPAHAVPSDVPLENMLAFINEIQDQPAYIDARRGKM